MLDAKHQDDLSQLAWALATAWRELPLDRPQFEPAPVTGTLVGRITSREPYRSRALEEASLLLIFLPAPLFQARVRVREPVVYSPFEHWQVTIAPLQIDLSWCRDMSGGEWDGYLLQVERVAIEDEQWKIVEVMSAGKAGAIRQQLARLKQSGNG